MSEQIVRTIEHTNSPQSVDTPQIIGLGGIALALVGFLGAWAFNQITHGWKEDIIELRAGIAELKTTNDLYVRRDDYIRSMDSIDKKLDAMASRQDQILSRQDQQFQVLLNKLMSRGHSNDSNDSY